MNQTRARISVAQPVLEGNEAKYLADCIATEWLSAAGPYVSRFETAFAEFTGVKHAIACANGTVALHLALLGLGVGPGDEVIVPTLTYIATANAVRYCGATPVFADSDPVTMNIDPADVERRITSKTVAIIPVHLYGHPAAMGPLLEIAERHGLWVVEDAAEAVGARYANRPVGGFGQVNTFSFFGNKIITTGEGGMLTTDDDGLERRLRLYAGQGMDPQRRYWFTVVGYNYRMTNMQAAVGVAQMERVAPLLQARQDAAAHYNHHLGDLIDNLELPTQEAGVHHVYWMYTVTLRDGARLSRDELMSRLDADGIETRPAFHPIHTLPPYRRDGTSFPVAERIGRQGISLPTHGRLSEDDVVYIAERIRHYLADR